MSSVFILKSWSYLSWANWRGQTTVASSGNMTPRTFMRSIFTSSQQTMINSHKLSSPVIGCKTLPQKLSAQPHNCSINLTWTARLQHSSSKQHFHHFKTAAGCENVRLLSVTSLNSISSRPFSLDILRGIGFLPGCEACASFNIDSPPQWPAHKSSLFSLTDSQDTQ